MPVADDGPFFADVARNVRVDRVEDVDEAMASIRDRGFINFFGEPWLEPRPATTR